MLLAMISVLTLLPSLILLIKPFENNLMLDILKDFYDNSSTIDLIYLTVTILSLIKCYRKGFVLSILSMIKWLLAYIITLILFPKIKPYLKDIIDNEYILDVGLGITIFIVIIFFVLIINKGISKAVKYTGIGSMILYLGYFWIYKSIYYLYVSSQVYI